MATYHTYTLINQFLKEIFIYIFLLSKKALICYINDTEQEVYLFQKFKFVKIPTIPAINP